MVSLDLPGADLVEAGVRDLEAGVESVEGLLVTRAAPRLREAGVAVPAVDAQGAEQRLHHLLGQREGNGAHAAYNALTRRIVSYCRARERAT